MHSQRCVAGLISAATVINAVMYCNVAVACNGKYVPMMVRPLASAVRLHSTRFCVVLL